MAEETYHVPAPLESFASWPAWQRAEHLTHCCHFCRDPYTVHHLNLGACAGCGQLGCSDCVRGCDDCYEIWGPPDCECDRDALEDPDVCNCQRSAPRYCFDCHHGCLHEVHCGRVVCARHLKFHDDTAVACERWDPCCDCVLHHRKVRDTLVREVERNLLLGVKDRAAPAEDAPTATVLLDRLTRTGQEPMASVVLDFAGGRQLAYLGANLGGCHVDAIANEDHARCCGRQAHDCLSRGVLPGVEGLGLGERGGNSPEECA